MKLRSLVIRTILAWVPILPPPPLFAQPPEEVSLAGPPVDLVVAGEARFGTGVSVINRALEIVGRNSGG
jgi:hypothetical protein